MVEGNRRGCGQDMFSALFEYNPVESIAVDKNGCIFAINKAKRDSSDRIPEMGDVMYRDYAGEHEIDMHFELMECIRTGKARSYFEMVYGEKILSIKISPFDDGAIIISEDVTKSKEMEVSLRLNEERLRLLIEGVANMAVQGYKISPSGDAVVTLWNSAAEDLYGYTRDEALGRNLIDLIVPDDLREWAMGAICDMAQRGEVIPSGEMTLMKRDGSPVDVYSSHVLIGAPENAQEMFCVDFDLTGIKKMQSALIESEALLKEVTNLAQDAMIMINSEGKIVFWSPSAERILGYSSSEVMGNNLTHLITPKEEEECKQEKSRLIKLFGGRERVIGPLIESRVRHKDGRTIQVQVSVSPRKIGDKKSTVIVLRDVTIQKVEQMRLEKSEKAARYLSTHDVLTGLYNRLYGQDEVVKQMSQAKRHGQPLSIVMFDVDHFKKVNDNFGHPVGDEVLKEIARVLKEGLRVEDTSCRWGGEEFLILLPFTSKEVATEIAKRFQVEICHRINIKQLKKHKITVSCGVVQYNGSETPDEVYKRVDDLLYLAKKNGRNKIVTED